MAWDYVAVICVSLIIFILKQMNRGNVGITSLNVFPRKIHANIASGVRDYYVHV